MQSAEITSRTTDRASCAVTSRLRPLTSPRSTGIRAGPLSPALMFDAKSRRVARSAGTKPKTTPVTRARAWRAGHAFELIAELFQTYVMPPQSAAQMFHALGTIRRVKADEHAVDVARRHGTGFLLTGTGGNQEIIVDPRTYHFAGYQFLGSGRDIHAAGAWGMAILRQALVPGPGVRPSDKPAPGKP